MQFLVDECTEPKVAIALQDLGHGVFSVYKSEYKQARGLGDDSIIKKAYSENRILIRNDKDFGEKVFKEKLPYHDVVFLRLADERARVKVSAIGILHFSVDFIYILVPMLQHGNPVSDAPASSTQRRSVAGSFPCWSMGTW